MKPFTFRDIGFMARVQATQVVVVPPILLLRGQGANVSTVFVDDAPSPHSVAALGDATLSTVQFKFGTSSFKFPGFNNSRIGVMDRADLNVGTSNFTLEGWIYPTGGQGNFRTIVTKRQNSNTEKSFLIILFNDNTLRLFVSSGTGGWDVFSSINFGTVNQDTWTHFALSRNGSTWYLFLNGALASTQTSAAGIGSTTNDLLFGADSDSANFSGYGHFRLSSTCLYATPFTPPSSL